MSFYAGYQNVTLLFASWMPTSKAGFVLSCLAIMLAAASEVMLRKIVVRVERRLMRSRQPVLRKNAQRAVLTFVQSTLSYAIMLLAMTFDVYIFFSIMVGFALGTLVAGHWNDEPGMASSTYEAHHSELQLSVTGMVCDACCCAVESALLAVPGVESAVVDLQSARWWCRRRCRRRRCSPPWRRLGRGAAWRASGARSPPSRARPSPREVTPSSCSWPRRPTAVVGDDRMRDCKCV